MSSKADAIEVFLTASKLMKESKYQKALDHFTSVEGKLSEVPALFYNKASIYDEIENFEDGLKEINNAINLDPNNAKYLKLKLTLLQKREKYDLALNTAEAILNIEYDIDVLINLGYLMLRQDRLAEASQIFESLLKDGCNDPSVYFTLGVLKYQSDNLTEAENLMQEAINQGYNTEEATRVLIAILQKNEKSKEALNLLEEMDSRSEVEDFTLARLYKQNGDIEQAKTLIQSLIDKFDKLDYINFKAHLLREHENYRSAIKLYDEVISRDDENLSAIKGKALSLMEIGEVEEANTLFEKGERIKRGGVLPDFDKMVEELDILD